MELFFEKLPTLFNFNQTVNKDNIDNVSEPIEIYFPEKINEITDIELLNLINPVLEKNRVLEAVEICIKFYENKFKEMTFKDWFKLINGLYKKINDKK